jgi:Glycosyl transferase family 2
VSQTPLVTVCIPSYNHAPLLPRAVESVLGQTYGNLECLIFDDGSTDGSRDLAFDFEHRDKRVRVASHEKGANRGITATVNAAYAQARGDYVAALAADDVFVEDSIGRRMTVMRSCQGIDFVYGRMEMLDADGRPTGQYGGVSPEAICGFDRTSDRLHALLLHHYIPMPTLLVRSELFARVDGMTDGVYYNDWELCIKFLAHGAQPGFVGGEPLVRCMPGAYGDEYDWPRRLEMFRALSGDAQTIGGRLTEPRVRALIALQHALHAAQLGEESEAREALGSAFGVDPGLRKDVDFLFWWLGPLQRRRLPDGDPAAAEGGWAQRLASPARAISEGARAGSFPCWAIEAVQTELSAGALESVRWAVIGNELELAGARPRPRAFGACVVNAMRRPELLRDRWFGKALLCAAGIWPVAARARRLRAP